MFKWRTPPHCPCGYYNHPEKLYLSALRCAEIPQQSVSGPLLDRIDLYVEVTPVVFTELNNDRQAESPISIREHVMAARNLQAERYKEHPGIYANAQINTQLMREYCRLNNSCNNLLTKAMECLNLSARAYDRILKVSCTIANLNTSQEIRPEHLADAIQYRSLDREGCAG
ncbi:ATP-binding protein [Asinibacterium sp. OR53]|uniref:magnesium chelatase subunit ChlI family protein n=1 Tax=Asinibacterium sp. OR53 TaxID=925409 RepID=UPI00047D8A2D|nr:ATP-binding protein [Asinibacterium sp. OR53]